MSEISAERMGPVAGVLKQLEGRNAKDQIAILRAAAVILGVDHLLAADARGAVIG